MILICANFSALNGLAIMGTFRLFGSCAWSLRTILNMDWIVAFGLMRWTWEESGKHTNFITWSVVHAFYIDIKRLKRQ